MLILNLLEIASEVVNILIIIVENCKVWNLISLNQNLKSDLCILNIEEDIVKTVSDENFHEIFIYIYIYIYIYIPD